jgi:tetratricopeptide (TPR) repeat protein
MCRRFQPGRHAAPTLKRYAEALASCDRALAARPDHAEALNNRGNILQGLKRFDEALASYDRAIAVRPDDAEALSNRGLVLHELRRCDEALGSYDRALALRPDHADARHNDAQCRLLVGDFDRGWRNFEARWTPTSCGRRGGVFRNPYGGDRTTSPARPFCCMRNRASATRFIFAATYRRSPSGAPASSWRCNGRCAN